MRHLPSPCGRTADYSMANMERTRRTSAAKVLILLGVHGLAGYAHRVLALGVPGRRGEPLAEALATIGEELSLSTQPTLLENRRDGLQVQGAAGQGQRWETQHPLPCRANTTYAVTVHRINKLRPVYAECRPGVEHTLPDLRLQLKARIGHHGPGARAPGEDARDK